jgi:hypothetical protein
MNNKTSEIPSTAAESLLAVDRAKDAAAVPGSHQRREIVTTEQAEALERNTAKLGDISVRTVVGPGEDYVNHVMPIALDLPGRPRLPIKSVRGVVPDGYAFIETTKLPPSVPAPAEELAGGDTNP